MNELGIQSLMCRKCKKSGPHVDYAQRPNLIKQKSLKYILQTDITYLRLNNGPLVYLSNIFDNQNAQIITQKINKPMTNQSVTDTLLRALQQNKTPEYLHSDMRSQYNSAQFENLLEQNPIQHSTLIIIIDIDFKLNILVEYFIITFLNPFTKIKIKY